MMRKPFDQKESTWLNQAIGYYSTQLYYELKKRKDEEKVKQWMQTIPMDLFEQALGMHWLEFDVSCFEQLWPTTSCGWGGPGGDAMTSNYTTLIESKYFNLLAVFYDGKLAYCIQQRGKI